MLLVERSTPWFAESLWRRAELPALETLWCRLARLLPSELQRPMEPALLTQLQRRLALLLPARLQRRMEPAPLTQLQHRVQPLLPAPPGRRTELRWLAPLGRRAQAPALGPRWPALSPAASNVERAIRWLDSAVPIPGTRLRVGLDPVLGVMFPAIGDVVSGAASLGILCLAVQYRVPRLIIGRMLFNVAIDTALGSVPIVGDVFDFVWKANDKNLALLGRHRSDIPRPPSRAYRLYVGGLWLLGLACIVAPLGLALFLL